MNKVRFVERPIERGLRPEASYRLRQVSGEMVLDAVLLKKFV